MRDLLNNFSTLQIALIFVVGAAVISLAAVWIVESLHGDLREGAFDEASSAVLATFTLLFGLLLALTISGLTSSDSSARSAVQREATALAQLTRTSQAFKPAARVRFKAAIAQYDHAVVEDEFVTMKSGRQSPLVAGALQNLYAVYQSYNPTATELGTSYMTSLGRLDDITAIRRERLQISSDSLSPVLRIMLFVGTIVFIILAYPAKIQKRYARFAVVAGTAGFVSFVFALTILLDYPFSSDPSVTQVTPAPYKDATLAQFWPGI